MTSISDTPQLLRQLHSLLNQVGDSVEFLNSQGVSVNLCLHQNNGESFEVHGLTGEFDLTASQRIEYLNPPIFPPSNFLVTDLSQKNHESSNPD